MSDAPVVDAVAPAPAADAAPASAAAPEQTELLLSDEVKAKLNEAHAKVNIVLARLGSLQADYEVAKAKGLKELDEAAKARIGVLNDAAKAAGLDLEKSVWALDNTGTKLVKQPVQG